MQYEKYELKIQRIEKLFKFILKHLGKAIVLCSLIATTTVGLFIAKGTVTTKDNTLPMEVYYGETFQYEAKAFMSDVEYEYAPLGSDAWSKDVPLVPGEYQVRAVAKATFGYRYGDPEAFTIKKKPMTVSISASGVHYGAEPSVSTSDLVYADRLAGATFTYNADHSHAEIASVLIHDEYGTDITSRYEIVMTGRDIYTTHRPVTIAIEDAVKIYDGTPLTSDRYALTAGSLAPGDRLEVTFDTSLTDVGRVQSEATYKITNAAGEETTQLYEITETLGYLEVLARRVSIKTGSLTVTYDAKPHSNKGFEPLSELSLVEGHTLSVDAWAEITNAGSVVNAFSEYQILDAAGNDVTKNYVLAKDFGILTVNKKVVTLSTPNAGKVYDGTPLSTDTYLPSDENVVGIVDGHSWTVSGYQSIVNAGTVDNTLSLAITDGAGNDVSSNYVVAGTWGTLTVTQRPLTVTTDSYTGIYDGKNHADELKSTLSAGGNTALVDGHAFSDVKPLGSVQNVSDKLGAMAFTIVDASGAPVTGNYRITPEWGTVTISPRPITVKTASGSKIYDGKPLTKQEWEIVNPDDAAFLTELGHTVDGSNITGSVTNVLVDENGAFLSAPNTYNADAQRVVKDANGVAVSENYAVAISDELGTLEVEPAVITIVTDSATKNYDGTPLTKKAWKVTSGALLAGHTVDTSMILGSDTTDVGVYVNAYDKDQPIRVLQGGTDVSSNYTVDVDDDNLGTLTIKKRVVVCSPKGASQTYNGNPLSNDKFEYVGTVHFLDTHSVTAKGPSITDVGSRPNNLTFTVTETVGDVTKDVTGNYDIRQTSVGVLTVTPRTIVITTDTRTWVYDAREHDAYEPDAALNPSLGYTLGGEGLVGDHVIEVPTLIAKLTYAGEAENAWAEGELVHIFDGKDDVTHNYKIEPTFGTLTVTKRPISIGTWSYEGEYDAIDHTPDAENVMFTLEGSLSLCDGHWFKTGTKPTIKNVTSEPNQYDYAIYDGTVDVTANYEIVGGEPQWGTITVTPKQITVTPVPIGDFTYDGIDHSYKSDLTATGLLPYHAIVIDEDSKPKLLNVNRDKQSNQVIPIENIFSFKIIDTRTGETISRDNYIGDEDTVIDWEKITISPIEITIKSNTIGNFYYDGTDHSYLSYLTAENLPDAYELFIEEQPLPLKDVMRDAKGNVTYIENIIKYRIVKKGTQVEAKFDGNYEITEPTWEKITISPRPITITQNDIKDFYYDGTDHRYESTLTSKDLPAGHEILITKYMPLLNVNRDENGEVIPIEIALEFIIRDKVTGEEISLSNYAYGDNNQLTWKKVTIKPIKLTFTPNDVQDFDYDGTDHSHLSTLTANGLLDIHELVITKNTSLLSVIRDEHGMPAEIENYLEFKLYVKGTTEDVENNYEFDRESIEWDKVKISPRKLTFTVTNPTKTEFEYDGTDHSVESNLTVENLPDQYELVIIEKPSLKDVQRDKYGNVIGIRNEIKYVIREKLSPDVEITLDENNYIVEGLVWSDVTITPKALILTQTEISDILYDGTDHSHLSTLTAEGVLEGQKFVFERITELRNVNRDPLTNEVIPIVNEMKFYIVDEVTGEPIPLSNYAYGNNNQMEWKTVTIKPIELTIVADEDYEFVYDLKDHSHLSTLTANGLLDIHELVITERTSLLNVNRDKDGNVIAIENKLDFKLCVKGTDDDSIMGNYEYEPEEIDWCMVKIKPIELTFKPVSPDNFIYDGKDHAKDITLTVENLPEQYELVIIEGTRTPLLNVARGEDGKVIPIAVELKYEIRDKATGFRVSIDDGNYQYDEVKWNAVTIKPIELTFKAEDIEDFVYNGEDFNEGRTETDLTADKLLAEHVIVITGRPELKNVNRNADGTVIPIRNRLEFKLCVKGTDDDSIMSNYEYKLEDIVWDTVTISPRVLTFTPNAIDDFTYDFKDHSGDSTLKASGLLDIHELVITKRTPLLNVNRDENGKVIPIKNVLEFKLCVKGMDDDSIMSNYEYKLEDIIWDEVTIKPIELTFTPSNPGSFEYDGTDHSKNTKLKLSYRLTDLYTLKIVEGSKTPLLNVARDENGNVIPIKNVLEFKILCVAPNGTSTEIDIDDGNYTIYSVIHGVTVEGRPTWDDVTIVPRTIYFMPQIPSDFVYDGIDHSQWTGLSVNNLPAGYTLEIVEESKPSLLNVARDKNGNVIAIPNGLEFKIMYTDSDGKKTEVDLDDGNYTLLSYVDGAYREGRPTWGSVIIYPKELVFKPINPGDFEYDGTDHSYMTGLEIETPGYYVSMLEAARVPLKDIQKDAWGNVVSIPNGLTYGKHYKIYSVATGKEINLEDGNYTYVKPTWENVTISPRTLTFIPINPEKTEFMYDGTDHSYMTDLKIENLPDHYWIDFFATKPALLNVARNDNGDVIAIPNGLTYGVHYQIYNAVTGEVVDLNDGNHIWNVPKWEDVTILPVPITITPIGIPNFQYDGLDHRHELSMTAEGLLEGHTLIYSPASHYTLKDVKRNPQTNELAPIACEMTYYIWDANMRKQIPLSNYQYESFEWPTVTISPRVLTFTPINPGDFTYDGTDHSYQTGLTVDNLPDHYELVVTPKTTLKNASLWDKEAQKYIAFANKVEWKILDKKTGAVIDLDQDNFKLFSVIGENTVAGKPTWNDVTILPKSITLTQNEIGPFYYDGKDHRYESTLTATGLLNGHELVYSNITELKNVNRSEIGKVLPIVNKMEFYILDRETREEIPLTNYLYGDHNEVEWKTVTILPLKLTFEAGDVLDFDYDGTDHSKDSTLKANGLLNGHKLAITGYTPLLNVTRDKDGNPIPIKNELKFKLYDEKTGLNVETNYEFALADIAWDTVKISPRELTFTPINPVNFTYDGTDHSYMTGLTVENLPSQYELVIISKTSLKNASAWDEEKQQYVAIPNNVEWEIRDRATGQPIVLDKNNYTVYSTVDGTRALGNPVWKSVTIEPKPITVSSAGYVAEYDGVDHTDDWWNVLSGDLCMGHSFTIKKKTALCNVSRNAEDEVVSIDNEMEFYIVDAEGKDVSANYKITEAWGKVTITPRVIKIKTGTQRWLYEEGTAYSCLEYKILYGDVAQAAGHELYVVEETAPTISDYGWVENKLSFVVKAADGTDYTKNYVFQCDEYGKLIIPQPIAVYLPAQRVEYDATEKRIEVYNAELLTALDPNLQVKLIGMDMTLQNVGSINSADLSGLNAPVRFYVYDKDTDEYVTDLYYIVVQDRKTQESYTVLTVTQRNLIIKVGNAQKPYDGIALEHKEYYIYSGSLADGHSFDPNNNSLISSSITDVGETKNEIPLDAQQSFQILDDESGNSVTGNYKIKFLPGTLTVTSPAN